MPTTKANASSAPQRARAAAGGYKVDRVPARARRAKSATASHGAQLARAHPVRVAPPPVSSRVRPASQHERRLEHARQLVLVGPVLEQPGVEGVDGLADGNRAFGGCEVEPGAVALALE
eukprot:scaffold25722_cov109-Isochrysis_galbana.AAC.11